MGVLDRRRNPEGQHVGLLDIVSQQQARRTPAGGVLRTVTPAQKDTPKISTGGTGHTREPTIHRKGDSDQLTTVCILES